MKFIILFVFSLVIIQSLFSQTGPGGVGNSSSNGLWLKADDLSQENNTVVPTWNDASGNNNNAAQLSTTLQPLCITSSSLNNMPILRFDGVDDEMSVADSPILDGTTGITYYTVLRPNNLNGSPRGILGKRVTFTDPTNYAYTWFFYSGNRLTLDIDNNNNRFGTGSATFTNATNYILAWDFDGSLAPSQRSGIRNGSSTLLRSTETSASMPNSNQDLAIGALNVGYGIYLGADYAEIIHYNYALSSLDHQLLQNYLSAKYNISLAANDFYDEDDAVNGNFDFDVAGIGQVSSTDINNNAQGSGIVNVLNPTNLDNDEYLIWGHNDGIQEAIETTDVPVSLQARFDRVWRVSEVSSSLSSVDVGSIDIRFDLTGLGAITATDLRLLVDTDNDGLFNDETPIGGASNVGGNVFQFPGISSIENNLRFTLGTINIIQTPLPITLINFTTTLVDQQYVNLNWQTASELNNDYFVIERSVNSVDWEVFAKVQGAGTSSTILNYNALDKTPYTGISYYRLKQTDYNGEYSYSKVNSVNITNTKIELFPNPTENIITLKGSLEELENIKIYNTLGQDVTSLTKLISNEKTTMLIDLSTLKNGLYYIKSRTTVNKVYKK